MFFVPEAGWLQGLFFRRMKEMENSKIVRFCDCTLCQGEKTPEMSFRERIELCRLLDRLNVDLIELTEIRQKKIDSLLIKSVSQTVQHAQIAVPVFLNPESVGMTWDALKEARHPRLQVPASVSSVQMEYLYHLKPAVMLEKTVDTIRACVSCCSDVEFIAQDATRSDPAFLRKIVAAAIEAGASTVTFCDTAGSMLPDEVAAFLRPLLSDIPALSEITVGYACTDPMNLADACAIAAIACGIREIKAAAFNTDSISLKNVVRILHSKGNCFGVTDHIGVEKIRMLTNQIETLCRAGLGHRINTAEYPGDALHGQITLSAHESKESIQKAVVKLGYDLTDDDLEKVWSRFQNLSDKKDVITMKELEAIIATEAMQVPPAYADVQYVINTGNTIGAMSHMILSFHGKPLEGISAGDGAIDAAFRSIETATGRHFELDDFQIQSVTEGREAMGETLVKLRSDGKLYSGKGISTDIVGASIMAYVNALNKIIYEEEET